MTNLIPAYPTDRPINLDPCGTWPKSVHRFDRDTVAALRAAEAAGRPLLLRGVPGTGKSQTARAAAAATGRLFVSIVIDGRSEAQDLQWRYDAVARLSDAYVPGRKAKDEGHYVSPGPLWWAYDWTGAGTQWNRRKRGNPPQRPKDWQPEHGTVLLLDEIDKADPDLPNAFLEVLSNQGFSVPMLGKTVTCSARPPLVIITTNEERDLPDAFLRRCFVHLLQPAADLQEMAKLHLERRELRSYPSVLDRAAELIQRDREKAREHNTYASGLAEYLDLVIAVASLESTEAKQLDCLNKTAGFVLGKGQALDRWARAGA